MAYSKKPTEARYSASLSVGEAVNRLLEVYRLKSRFNETAIQAHWEQLMGKTISKHTKNVYVRDGKLYIKITSSSLKQELLMARTKIIELLNKEYGQDTIQEVIFL